MSLKSDGRFNPLEIGSSVLIPMEGNMFLEFLSGFQSPRNRVKRSDKKILLITVMAVTCFNPLEIGSSVLMQT